MKRSFIICALHIRGFNVKRDEMERNYKMTYEPLKDFFIIYLISNQNLQLFYKLMC
jgi:hypothetical protein